MNAVDTTLKAFTVTGTGTLDKLISSVEVGGPSGRQSVKALWDTGATTTCISTELAQSLALVKIGAKNVETPGGPIQVDTFVIDLLLPNNVPIDGIIVCASPHLKKQGIDVLIGMNVIGMGDFAVSNYDEKTVFTFRTPSQGRTDYVKQIARTNTIGKPHSYKGIRKK